MKRWVLATLLTTASVSTWAQCVTRIEPIPLEGTKDVKTQALLSKHEFVLYKTPLNNGVMLEVLGVHDGSPFGGHMERGIRIVRGSTVLAEKNIAELPEFQTHSTDPDDSLSDSYRAMASLKACTNSSEFAAVSFHWSGDITSPELLMTVTRIGERYVISALPTISAGVFEFKRTNASRARVWTNMHEGGCNACETHYEIDEYVFVEGTPKLTRKHTSKQLYTSGDIKFPENALLLVP
ncbi:hypothetical protein ACFQBQ_17265 [Granulicella cerasi]|uniref:Uncharacterized protein n=1 Tax=Granulicella cerasi TaxID=741063 RepID=A0ABW1ZF39_9BACT|nr:hypothetical protein [Granulicella cerasi]